MSEYNRNLWEVLSGDERIIVYSENGEYLLVTWNQRKTLQCWGTDLRGGFVELSQMTLETEPKDYKEARAKAVAWIYQSDQATAEACETVQ